MIKRALVLRKILLIFAILNILMCPLLFIGGEYFPASLRGCFKRDVFPQKWSLREKNIKIDAQRIKTSKF